MSDHLCVLSVAQSEHSGGTKFYEVIVVQGSFGYATLYRYGPIKPGWQLDKSQGQAEFHTSDSHKGANALAGRKIKEKQKVKIGESYADWEHTTINYDDIASYKLFASTWGKGRSRESLMALVDESSVKPDKRSAKKETVEAMEVPTNPEWGTW